MTWVIIAACVVVYLFLQSPAFQQSRLQDQPVGTESSAVVQANEFIYRWTAVPCEVTSGKTAQQGAKECHGSIPAYVNEHGKNVWASVFFSMWLHGGLLHIAGNMLFLWVFGRMIEDRVGHGLFLAVYLVGGVVSILAFSFAHYHSTDPGLGASGAIAAIMGVAVVLQPRRRLLSILNAPGVQVAYFPAWAVLGLFFASQFFYGDKTVAWEAHVGGMIFGALCGLLVLGVEQLRRRRTPEPVPAPAPLGMG